MDILFANRKLEKYGNNFSLAQRKPGNDRETKYHQRLGDMRDINSFAELEALPGNVHPLTANRNAP